MGKRRMVVVVDDVHIHDFVAFCLQHSLEMHVIQEPEAEEGIIIGPAPRHLRQPQAIEHQPRKTFKKMSPPRFPITSGYDAEHILEELALRSPEKKFNSADITQEAVRRGINPTSLGHASRRMQMDGRLRKEGNPLHGFDYFLVVKDEHNKEQGVA